MLFSDDAKAYDLALDTFAASQGVRDVPGIYHAVRKTGLFFLLVSGRPRR